MRAPVDRERIEALMDRLGRAASVPVRVYLVGGTSAVLVGWREGTIDVDLAIRPHDDALLRAIPDLKNALDVNIELASPADFIPLPTGWEDRSPLVTRRHHEAGAWTSAGCRGRPGDVGARIDRADEDATVFR
jgi:hypothetical protein